MNPATCFAANQRLSGWADESKKIQREGDQNLENENEKGAKDMIEVSPMIFASALANLSSTELASGGDRHRTMARADSARERHSARL